LPVGILRKKQREKNFTNWPLLVWVQVAYTEYQYKRKRKCKIYFGP